MVVHCGGPLWWSTVVVPGKVGVNGAGGGEAKVTLSSTDAGWFGLVWFGLVYWGLTPQKQPGSYQGGEMMMMKSVLVGDPEYPEETTDLRQVTGRMVISTYGLTYQKPSQVWSCNSGLSHSPSCISIILLLH